MKKQLEVAFGIFLHRYKSLLSHFRTVNELLCCV